MQDIVKVCLICCVRNDAQIRFKIIAYFIKKAPDTKNKCLISCNVSKQHVLDVIIFINLLYIWQQVVVYVMQQLTHLLWGCNQNTFSVIVYMCAHVFVAYTQNINTSTYSINILVYQCSERKKLNVSYRYIIS